ncbi:helix-turn-helix transcriptional regulator [Cupriavidus sp. UYPR2.512]|uniref:helix-turn-helix transcriptional regulator n=1 Tax=Cupriavidus sp. UYPR2.512 TaxID=1080187 RepID=UPI00055EEA9C|nr:helix-turn-helix transcriptional regulator [Cupriavidus sp. UYPR2.512]UIF90892.1 helix-turn-helix transcriptional regulator [Cupriavidus necator]
MKLNEQIGIAREARGLSRDDLAEHLGVSKTSVVWWEEGKHAPRLPMLRKIETILETKFNATGTELAEGQSAAFPGVSPQDVQLAVAISRLPAAQRLAIQTLVEASAPGGVPAGDAVKPFTEMVENETPRRPTQQGRKIVHATEDGSESLGVERQRSAPRKKATTVRHH